eukprot:CAMPEP_0117000052 /NCGR_PEP_ID=MMETSP0472-20121206/2530_1 /TAXON_ID=693140 ORGANISM="Tiarina fusus, Strain LIS" /NCGR_SAMPLE_ID=MMETSP0472 /ASSEMBLY_ACC=CAM_ASM_000603 /LENGTH=158 /DNA_ID=CAMNT_0004699631 /DNA_START=48 /DNA_END=524 /DNA_ORIENTATION=-
MKVSIPATYLGSAMLLLLGRPTIVDCAVVASRPLVPTGITHLRSNVVSTRTASASYEDEESSVHRENEVDCELQCCFESMKECEEHSESVCATEKIFPECEKGCDLRLSQGEIDGSSLEDCYDDCNFLQKICFEEEEAFCTACEEEAVVLSDETDSTI